MRVRRVFKCFIHSSCFEIVPVKVIDLHRQVQRETILIDFVDFCPTT